VQTDAYQGTSWDILNTFIQDTAWDTLNTFEQDIAWDILNTFTQAFAWDTLNTFEQAVAWDIINTFVKDVTWAILNTYTKDVSWDTLNDFDQGTSWSVFARTLHYIKQFHVHAIAFNFGIKQGDIIPWPGQNLSNTYTINTPVKYKFTIKQPINFDIYLATVHFGSEDTYSRG
jgi:hypothetical protein